MHSGCCRFFYFLSKWTRLIFFVFPGHAEPIVRIFAYFYCTDSPVLCKRHLLQQWNTFLKMYMHCAGYFYCLYSEFWSFFSLLVPAAITQKFEQYLPGRCRNNVCLLPFIQNDLVSWGYLFFCWSWLSTFIMFHHVCLGRRRLLCPLPRVQIKQPEPNP